MIFKILYKNPLGKPTYIKQLPHAKMVGSRRAIQHYHAQPVAGQEVSGNWYIHTCVLIQFKPRSTTLIDHFAWSSSARSKYVLSFGLKRCCLGSFAWSSSLGVFRLGIHTYICIMFVSIPFHISPLHAVKAKQVAQTLWTTRQVSFKNFTVGRVTMIWFLMTIEFKSCKR